MKSPIKTKGDKERRETEQIQQIETVIKTQILIQLYK